VYEEIFYVASPPLLMFFLFILYTIYAPTFRKIGVKKREFGLLFLGSFATMFLNMPLFIYKNYFLAINVGGGLIPLILSFYLIKENELHFMKIFTGIVLVSISTYMVTKVTIHGVISYFPFYLLPPVLAFLIGMLFYFLSPESSAYSYSVSTLGVIIGGDFSHLPDIFSRPFVGSMGGAGLYDMVYFAGILSFFLSFIFVKKIKRDKRKDVIEKIRELSFLYPEGIKRIYEIDEKDLRREAKKIWKKIGIKLKKYLAGEDERMLAFLIDCMIISAASFLISIFHIFFFADFLSSFLITFSIIQLFYFFLLEYFFNATIGKAFTGIEIRKENFDKIDFMDAFTRNILRYFDMLALFYIISIIMISILPKKQRIGDIITGTIVVKSKCLK